MYTWFNPLILMMQTCMKAWLRILNMPFHHYTQKAVEAVAGRCGKVWAVDLERAQIDYSSLNVLVECKGVNSIPRQLQLCYDELHERELVILVDSDMDVVSFDQMGYGMCRLSYGEIFRMAYEGRKAKPISLDRLSIS